MPEFIYDEDKDLRIARYKAAYLLANGHEVFVRYSRNRYRTSTGAHFTAIELDRCCGVLLGRVLEARAKESEDA